MDAGQLNRRITVLRPTKVADGYGGITSSASTIIGTFWAKIQEMDGNIDSKNEGPRLRELSTELVLRSEVAYLIHFQDIVTIEGSNTEYRINSIFENIHNFWAKCSITAADNV